MPKTQALSPLSEQAHDPCNFYLFYFQQTFRMIHFYCTYGLLHFFFSDGLFQVSDLYQVFPAQGFH